MRRKAAGLIPVADPLKSADALIPLPLKGAE